MHVVYVCVCDVCNCVCLSVSANIYDCDVSTYIYK